jgi:hypothetical protein
MPRTSVLLEKYVYDDILPREINILVDYFGIHNIHDQSYINTIFGIYSHLIKIMTIDADILHEALINNSLDNLIHSSYKNYHCNTKYYQDFCQYNIKLQKNIDDAYFNFDIPNEDEIQKNICPNCNLNDYDKYFSKNQTPDCVSCYEFICIRCSITDKNETTSRICINCYNAKKSKKNLESNIKNKINSHKYYDRKRFDIIGDINVEDIKKLLEEQNNCCYNCNEHLELVNYKALCCYQFSIDRIDNQLPHNKNNIRISCYYCNCRHHSKFDQLNKVCNSKCHKVAKLIKK